MHRFLPVLSVLLLCLSTAQAQSVTGTLSGKVTGANGAAVPSAAVTVTNVNTNTSQKMVTTADGSFSVSGLAPGTYRVEVESTGYQKTAQQTVTLTAPGPISVNITLEAGNTNETVEIKGTSPMTQGDNGEVGVGLGMRTMQELPVADRNHHELTGLQSGITPPVPATDPVRDPELNRSFSTNGQSPYVNQPELDGVVNLEPFRGVPLRVVPVEGVQEMDISTANHTMNKGFLGGAWYGDSGRAGSNGWHGSLFEFFSGSPLRTHNYFADNVDKPRFVFNQFGGTVGGAIAPDKTFFFGSYEGQYQRGTNTTISTVPTPQAAAGDFSAIPGVTVYSPFSGRPSGTTVLSPSQINPTSAAIASFIPAPNQPGLANNYIANVPFQNDHQKFDARIDHKMSDRLSLFLRYGYSNSHTAQASPLGSVIGADLTGRLVGQNAAIGATYSLSDRLVTDFRFGYNRYAQRVNFVGDQSPLANMLGLTNFNNNLIGVSIPGMPRIGAPAYAPETPVDNSFNWVWNWTLHTAKHNLKWGVDVRRYRSDGFLDTPVANLFGPNGTAYFGPGATLLNNGVPLSPNAEFYNSWAAFLLGAPSQVGVSSFLVNPSVRQTQYGLWVGDTVQLMPHVTADLGVRYEVYSPLEPANTGGAAYYDPTTNSFNFADVGGVNMHTSTYQLRNIAPRIGIAARINEKTVVRGGYGIHYFQMPYVFSGLTAPMTGSSAGVQGSYGTPLISGGVTGAFGPTVTSTVPPPGSLENGASAGNLPATVIPHNLPTPYVQTYSLQVQRDFLAGSVLSVGYVGSVSRHLPYIQELNAAFPGTGVAGMPFSDFGRTASTLAYDSGVNSNYNSLQVNFNKRFAKGLSFIASYTYSKSLGYTGNDLMLLNNFDLRSNYGPLDTDRQHMLSIGHLWEIPWGRHGSTLMTTLLGGWQLNGILSWQTGTPLTVTANPLLCACPGNTVLAGADTSSSLVTGNFGAGQSYFNNAAFFAPINANAGNLTRNSLRGPDFWNYNLSLFKDFRFRDRFNLEVRGEAYNLANSTHPLNPVSNFNATNFGLTSNSLYNGFGRQVNFGARVLF